MARRLGKPLGSRGPRNQRTIPSPLVVGRDRDISTIEGLIDRVREGGAALLISGDPGIGKSTLLHVAQELAHNHGMRVLRLCGTTSEMHLPFGGLQQALATMLRHADALPVRQRAALQAAFGLSEELAVPDIFLVALAALTLLTARAVRKPILLVADDIQWLDPPSRDVLAFISRRITADPIVVLMATRNGSEEAVVSGVLRLDLSELGAVAADQLLSSQAPDLPRDLRQRFLDEASGNPLALVELPRGNRAVQRGDLNWLPLTDRTRDGVFQSRRRSPAVHAHSAACSCGE